MAKFDQFTNLYSLSKTLRFELIPVGKTLENMKKHLEWDPQLQTFMKDQDIEDAYQTLKPAIDKIHEDFITKSLESDEAKKIDFSDYLKKYNDRENDKGEKQLRKQVCELYKIGGEVLKSKYSNLNLKWKKGGKIVEGYNVLLCQDILEVIKKQNLNDNKINSALETFKGFFTYLSGFNQNRENYYKTEGKASQITTRIIDENLPKFCDNSQQFFGFSQTKKDGKKSEFFRKEEYLNAYSYLKEQNRTTQIKDAESKDMIEAYQMTEEIFNIEHFSSCFSQKQIEVYNKIIGHYNLLINLYNQARQSEKDFIKLPKFKTLYKQIGCGKRNKLFFSLKYNFEKDLSEEEKEKTNEIYSVEKTLTMAKEFGELYFNGENKDEDEIKTVFYLNKWLKNRKEWKGVYWTKQAVNTISNKYFENWHEILDRLKNDISCVSYDKKREEQIKINDAVELSGLFEVIDQIDQSQGWSDFFFKKSIIEEKNEIINEQRSPSENLINFLCADIEWEAKMFSEKSEETIERFKNIFGNKNSTTEGKEEVKKQIKEWMDYALTVNRIVKYFAVKENKIKGDPINPELANILDSILNVDGTDWFKWYDALRNYLTKKPQDDAKENKLKLNFEKGNLLNGFVDSHSASDNATQYGGYLFRKYSKDSEEYEYFLGISKDAKLFRCHLQSEILENDKSDFNRLEYYQPKSTTFFSNEYSLNKKELIDYLSKEIKKIAKEKREDLDTEEEQKDLEKIEKKLLKEDSKTPPTPTGIIDSINKEKKYSEFKRILSNHNFISLVEETISKMKEFIKKYEDRTPKLKEVQNKKYETVFGLKKIIDDLQKISKETKVYNYFPVSQDEFDEVCERKENPLFIFKITNKDFSKKRETELKKIGKNSIKINKNLHTLYFEALLSGTQNTIDIGKGEVFYRQKAIKEKNIKNGYENKPWVIEGKRFTENGSLETENKESNFDGKSFFLHLSVILNYSKDKSQDINDIVYKNFSNQEEICYIGLDRGEKHLVYFSLIDQNGEIIKQGSFNTINGQNYLEKLVEKEGNRDEARKNWQTIGNIKNLKEGYISQVVHEITKIVQDKPTFVVLEDLNTGFKRGRQKIERQIYQKFELALAKKLNFLVNKNAKVGEIGSVTKALQLTPPVQNYGDIENRKQVGIMLYTRANYTSQTDPLTGWRKTIYLKSGSEESIRKQIEERVTDIGFEKGHYYFEYENGKIIDQTTGEITTKKCRLWSGHNGNQLLRYRGKRDSKNVWKIETIEIEKLLTQLFSQFKQEERGYLKDLLSGGKELQKIDDKHTAWESLRFVIDTIQQIRNSGDTAKGQDDNFLLSPVRDNNGNYFDSRKVAKEDGLPIDADANGAYNIARKGIIMNWHINKWIENGRPKKDKDSSDLDLFISDEEWDLWLNNKDKWKLMLPIFSSRKKMEEYRKLK